MKNTRTWIMLGVAVVCGLLAVLLAAQWLTNQSSRGVARIAVAATDISLGQRLTPDLIRLVDWPAASMPPGAHKEIAELDGRVLRASLLRGEAVIDAKLAPLGTTGGLSAVIGEGRRAMTVRVNDVIGVAGFALPGNYVDILVSTQRDSESNTARDKQISKIVLERILVLAVAQEVGRDDTKPRVVNAVTLEVTPEQAEKLDLARSVGSLSLVLRNQVDPQAAATDGATKSSLFEEKESSPARKKISEASAQTGPVSTKPKQAAQKDQRAPTAATSTKSPAIKAMPVATPAVNEAAAISSMACVGVINGLRNSTECY